MTFLTIFLIIDCFVNVICCISFFYRPTQLGNRLSLDWECASSKKQRISPLFLNGLLVFFLFLFFFSLVFLRRLLLRHVEADRRATPFQSNKISVWSRGNFISIKRRCDHKLACMLIMVSNVVNASYEQRIRYITKAEFRYVHLLQTLSPLSLYLKYNIVRQNRPIFFAKKNTSYAS